MFTRIEKFLPPQRRENLLKHISTLTWEDGQKTAGAGKNRKSNEQLTPNTESARPALNQISQFVMQHPAVQRWAEPRRIGRIMFSRYFEDHFYGSHNDAGVIRGQGGPSRADISFTIFLNEPSEYEGGELVLESVFGDKSFKEPAGTIVLYDTGFRHRVEKITGGSRIVVVGWLESLMRSPEAREIARDLKMVIGSVAREIGNDSEEAITLRRVYANLQRLLIET